MRGNPHTTTNTKLASLAPVILGPVPRIFWQQVSNLVNKLALLNKCLLREDSWDKPKNDWCWGRGFSLVASKQKSVAYSNKVMDTRLPQPAGCGDKYDVSGLGCRLLRRYTPRNDGTSNGEGLHRPWCHKILGTGPSMTGARGANSFGRSMIEMLGVLAIIGVLSVGGIAGYSKAMEKFKVNKLVEEYSNVIFQLLEHKDNLLRSNPQNQVFLADTMAAMNMVPESWVKQSKIWYKDSQGNNVAAYLLNGELLSFDMYLGGTTKNESGASVSVNFSVKLCTELLNNLALPLSSELFRVTVANSANDWSGTTRYGAKYCGTKDRKCIASSTLSDFQAMCKFCDGLDGECNIGIRF